jgi:hypothetical protein
VYGFTSLTPQQADPQRLLERIRNHWAIENTRHYRRDVTLREDACHVRKGLAPERLPFSTVWYLLSSIGLRSPMWPVRCVSSLLSLSWHFVFSWVPWKE